MKDAEAAGGANTSQIDDLRLQVDSILNPGLLGAVISLTGWKISDALIFANNHSGITKILCYAPEIPVETAIIKP